MMQTFVRPSRDLRNHYAEISEMLKDHNHVIITNHGRGESVLINIEDYAILFLAFTCSSMVSHPFSALSCFTLSKNWCPIPLPRYASSTAMVLTNKISFVTCAGLSTCRLNTSRTPTTMPSVSAIYQLK